MRLSLIKCLTYKNFIFQITNHLIQEKIKIVDHEQCELMFPNRTMPLRDLLTDM